ncbi:ABC transporter substrate-binding protein [Oceanobacillus alkalisoli]|uniref:ABC transporter substrate-binding protein n=1 Tax=Oceanobacillus alkalisoli TaxID=2925113 RepID=UPI001EF0DFC1|nr:ABC transporter substrate-binding protein [Oceanobacillus alkalisoli]MCF3942918.1 ABC transporter substrate-binding protein [Oceanobacillus alkalisoli]MCG5102341.1 ABC transporter substrate-binding protein [Oceanobacillus alkalisoli]
MKKLSLLGLLVLMLLILGACGGGDDAETNGGDAEESVVAGADLEDATELSFWTFAGTHADFYADAAEKWNEENPDKAIKLTVGTYPFDQMHNNLLLALQSGSGAPDLADIEIAKFPNFLKGDIQLEPLNDLIEPELESFVEERLDIYAADDIYYGAPTHLGATVVYYNQEIMDEAGVDIDSIKTWDDYVDAGKQVVNTTGKPMTTIPTNWYGIWPFVTQKESDFFNIDGEFTLDNEENIETLEFINSLINEHEIAEIAPGGNYHSEEFYGFMNEEGQASIVIPMYYMKDFVEYMPDLEGKMQIRPMPLAPGSETQSVAMGGTGTAVISQSEHTDLAKEFLYFAKLSKEGNIRLWTELGFDPPRWDVWEEPEVRADNIYYEFFHEDIFDILLTIKDDVAGINLSEYTPDVLSEIDSNIMHNVLREGNQTPEEALKQSADTIRQKMESAN